MRFHVIDNKSKSGFQKARYLQEDRSDCMGWSAATAGTWSKVETEAGRRKTVGGVEVAAVRCRMREVVCRHLQEAAV